MEWQQDLELGHREIDREHRQMFEEFYLLSLACERGEERIAILRRVTALQGYAVAHFATEECLMNRYGYPDVEEQRRHHTWFHRDLDDLAARVIQQGPSLELALTVRGKLLRWLIQHIQNVDRQMVQFITQREEPLPALHETIVPAG